MPKAHVHAPVSRESQSSIPIPTILNPQFPFLVPPFPFPVVNCQLRGKGFLASACVEPPPMRPPISRSGR